MVGNYLGDFPSKIETLNKNIRTEMKSIVTIEKGGYVPNDELRAPIVSGIEPLNLFWNK